MQQRSAIPVFCCYAHEDKFLLNTLRNHLNPLQRQELIDVWYDGEIIAGTEWEEVIKKHLDDAQIILLLISPDSISSNYCYSIEMQRALERHRRGEAHVIPIILRPVDWDNTPFSRLQALPTSKIPIVNSRHWNTQDDAFLDVVKGIGEAVQAVLKKNLTSHPLNNNKEDKSYLEEPDNNLSNNKEDKSHLEKPDNNLNNNKEDKSYLEKPDNNLMKRILSLSLLSLAVVIYSFIQKIQRKAIYIYQALPLSLRHNQFSSATIGIMCCSILLLFIQMLLLRQDGQTIGNFALLLVFIALPFFWGAIFGCWAGSFTGGAGIFLGTLLAQIPMHLLCLSKCDDIVASATVDNSIGPLNIDLALMGFFIGLIWYSRRDISFSFRSFIPRELLSLLAAVIAAFIACPYFNVYYGAYDQIFQSRRFVSSIHPLWSMDTFNHVIVATIINTLGVILLPLLHFFYRKIKKRKERKNMAL